MGTVGLAAQALGRRDGVEERAVLARAVLLAFALGFVLIVLQVPILKLALTLAGASDAVNGAVSDYFHVRIFAAPVSLANYAILGWLTGLGRTGRALALQVGMNVLNMVLTVVLVLGAGWGVAGAATGTLIAEAVGTGAGLLLVVQLLGGRLDVPRAVLLDKARLMEAFTLNRDIMIRTAALMFAFGFFAAQGARTGDVTLAANAVLSNMVMMAAYFLDGFATAAEQLCGQAMGARDEGAFSAAVRLVLAWGFGFALAASGLFAVAGGTLTDLMTTSDEVRIAARAFLPYAALVPLAGVAAYVYDGIFIGALWSRDMRNLMLAALALYLLAWLGLRGFGNGGLWMAFLVFLLARGGLQAARLPALRARAFARGPADAGGPLAAT